MLEIQHNRRFYGTIFRAFAPMPAFSGDLSPRVIPDAPLSGNPPHAGQKAPNDFPCRRPGTLGRFGAVRRCPCHSGRLLWQPQHCLYVPASSAFWGGFCLRRCGVSAGQCGGCPGQHPSAAGLSACHPHVQRRLCLSSAPAVQPAACGRGQESFADAEAVVLVQADHQGEAHGLPDGRGPAGGQPHFSPPIRPAGPGRLPGRGPQRHVG